MHVRNPREVGLLIKDRRRKLSLSQAELAARIGVSRHWVMGVEAGKPTVELGLVLAALSALDVVCNLRPRERFTGPRGPEARPGAPTSGSGSSTSPSVPNLSQILSRTRASGRDSVISARRPKS